MYNDLINKVLKSLSDTKEGLKFFSNCENFSYEIDFTPVLKEKYKGELVNEYKYEYEIVYDLENEKLKENEL